MINITQKSSQNMVKAVGLLSGGLDSTLAAKIIKDLNVDVYGVYFSMPWGCCDKAKAFEAAQKIGIKFITLQLDERYLEIVRKPKFGYGTALNPCVDCRIHMFSRAGQYMRHIGADFVFTGEVLNQRPMSQKAHSLKIIEQNAGLEGRLLRPLSAGFLNPTIPEKEGLIDRSKLLRITGRSRKSQMSMAQKLNLNEYNQPAGGCLLTDKNFAKRMVDTLEHGYRNFRETIALKWGRHFRLSADVKIIIGRDADENENLIRFAHPDDIIMQLPENAGPTILLKAINPHEATLQRCAGLLQRFSKYKNEKEISVHYWLKKEPDKIFTTTSRLLNEAEIGSIKI